MAKKNQTTYIVGPESFACSGICSNGLDNLMPHIISGSQVDNYQLDSTEIINDIKNTRAKYSFKRPIELD